MRRTNSSGMTVAVLGSMTSAMSAQHALASAAIRSEVMKQDGGGRGCSYGVLFPSVQQGNVSAILSSAHINVRRYEQAST